jgi:hypothetical protein
MSPKISSVGLGALAKTQMIRCDYRLKFPRLRLRRRG